MHTSTRSQNRSALDAEEFSLTAYDDNVIEFRRAIRGYDPTDVDRIVAELSERVERYEAERLENGRLIQRLTRELAEAHERSAQVKPSFAELGTAFEETLRVAERQAGKMLTDAAEEASERLSKARAESTRLRTQSTRESQTLLADAHQTAEELRLETEREVAQARQQAADETAKARNTRTRAERSSATMISQAERQVSQIQAEASHQAELIKREAAELLHEAQQKLVTTEAIIREQQDEAETARAAIHDEAEHYAQKAYVQADGHVNAAVQRAEDLSTEAESIVARATQRADEETLTARTYCERLVSATVTRATAVNRDTDELLTSMMMDAETQISDLRRQQHTLNQYVQRMRAFSLADETDASGDMPEYTPPSPRGISA
jgi:cell division septum initiation protein DivIVA